MLDSIPLASLLMAPRTAHVEMLDSIPMATLLMAPRTGSRAGVK